jgi:hypothetical protein
VIVFPCSPFFHLEYSACVALCNCIVCIYFSLPMMIIMHGFMTARGVVWFQCFYIYSNWSDRGSRICFPHTSAFTVFNHLDIYLFLPEAHSDWHRPRLSNWETLVPALPLCLAHQLLADLSDRGACCWVAALSISKEAWRINANAISFYLLVCLSG